MAPDTQFAAIENAVTRSGKLVRWIRISETGRYLVPTDQLPLVINPLALDVVDISLSTVAGYHTIAAKSPPTVTTELLGDGVILQVDAKCGPVSLVRLLLLADEPTVTIPDQQVYYGLEADVTILDVLVDQLLSTLEEVVRLGWAGGDQDRRILSAFPEGEIDFFESLTTSIERGQLLIDQRIVRYTLDISLNKVIATTLSILAASADTLTASTRERLYSQMLTLPPITEYASAAEAVSVCRLLEERGGIPPNREYYEPVLRFCRLLLERFALTQASHPEIEYPPLRLPMERLFERAVRNIVARALEPMYAVRSWRDDVRLGGRPFMYQRAVPSRFNANLQPDIVIRPSTTLQTTAALLDVKYKFEPDSSDHYQLAAYMSAYNAPIGGFIFLTDGTATLQEARTADDRMVYGYGFDLSQIPAEVTRLGSWLRTVL